MYDTYIGTTNSLYILRACSGSPRINVRVHMNVADDPVPSGEISWVAMNWLQHVATFQGIIEV